MTLTVAGKNQALDGGIEPDSVSLHSADPTSAGTANELSGGSPAYARKAIAFTAAASAGSKAMDGAVAFDIPAGGVVGYYALWQGGTCVDTGALSGESYVGQGVYNLTGVTIAIP